jgi:hypothetical protein
MSYTNYPSADTPQQQPQPPKDNRKVIYGILITVLVLTWVYIIYDKAINDKNQSDKLEKIQSDYLSVDSSRNAIQVEYNRDLARIDSLEGSNTQLKGELAERKNKIDQLKDQLRTELSKKNADLAKAKELESQLKAQVTDLFAQIDQLKQQNQQLTASNQQLTTERDTLTVQKHAVEQNLATVAAEKAHVEDIGSTLNVSGVNITALQVKHDGREVVTSKAKRADLFKISFNVENRISASGQKDLYVCVTGPDGKPITMPSNGSGSFTTRDEGDKVFTKQVSVQYTQGQVMPVSFEWKPENGKYAQGDYKVQIYQNGFKIGEGTITLKKAGFLG